MKDEDKATFNPPKHEIEAFARCIYPAILQYFESEEGQKEFAKWKAQQKELKGKAIPK